MAYPGQYGYGGQPSYPSQQGSNYGYAQPPPPAQPKNNDQQAQASQMQELRRQFDAVDKSGNGQITANELMNIPFGGGQKLSLETSRKLVKLFDRHGRGQISLQEYAPLHKFVVTTQASYMQADPTRTNRLDENQLQRALSTAGFNFTPPIVSLLYRKQGTGNGVNFENFVQLCALLGRLRATFDSLDSSRQGTINVNMEQLVNIAVHV